MLRAAAGGPMEQWQMVPEVGKLQILGAIFIIEHQSEWKLKPHYMAGGTPGDLKGLKSFWDPVGLTKKMDAAKLKRQVRSARLTACGHFACLAAAAPPPCHLRAVPLPPRSPDRCARLHAAPLRAQERSPRNARHRWLPRRRQPAGRYPSAHRVASRRIPHRALRNLRLVPLGGSTQRQDGGSLVEQRPPPPPSAERRWARVVVCVHLALRQRRRGKRRSGEL